MSFQADKDSQRRRKPETETDQSSSPARPRKKRAEPNDVGDALRSAYQRTLDENIPPEMLDLLGKLG